MRRLRIAAMIVACAHGGVGRSGAATWPTVVDLYVEDQDVIAYGPGRGSNLTMNEGLAIGDVDADGSDDLVVAAPFNSAWVFTGPRPSGTAFDLAMDQADIVLADGPQRIFFGSTLEVADVSGDGKADLIVGAMGDGALRGEVFVYFGPLARGRTLEPATSLADVRLTGVAPDDKFGKRIVVGDIDGDGDSDLLIGASRGIGDGGAYVIFGPLMSGMQRDLATTPADIVIRRAIPDFEEGLGNVLAIADVSGDGIGDLILGTSRSCAGGVPFDPCPMVYVFFGRARAAWPGLIDLATMSADVTLHSPRGQVSALAAGDVNGDGQADLLVGDAQFDLPGRELAGRVVAIFGPLAPAPVTDLDAAADAIILGADERDYTPSALRADDLDGDGIDDVVIGVEQGKGLFNRGDAGNIISQVGEVSVILGPLAQGSVRDLRDPPDLFVSGDGWAMQPSAFGAFVTLGDYSGDGLPDIASGSLFSDGPLQARPSCGEAYVIYTRFAECPVPDELFDLRVTKGSAPLAEASLSFAGIPGGGLTTANVYRGSIPSLNALRRYDHAAVSGGCGLTQQRFDVPPGPDADVYYLVVASMESRFESCEGSYGDARIGGNAIPRPSAADLGTATCP